ncbi:MAG: 23S rRNA (guanosine(2251)-2'-O)-methyltransferase RlmB [Brevinematales bacterium]
MFVYGRNSVEEALIEHLPIRRFVVETSKKGKYASLLSQAQQRNVVIEFLSDREISKLAGTQKHQGIAAEITLPSTVYEREELFSDWERVRVLLMLDGLTDTGNVGAILRSALLLGVDVVVLPEDHSARITPQVIRASAGALYRIPMVYVRNIVKTTESLKEMGFRVYGLDMHGEYRLDEVKFVFPLCLVVGSEHKGMRRMMRRACDELVSIPTTGKLDSLNASVATAVCLWEVYKCRYGGQ